uniref:Ig-like domain-containing protein n=1 Tax=Chrysemys picta bellii TaxID=8478 RepID=A0A8C3IR30_CHRPI
FPAKSTPPSIFPLVPCCTQTGSAPPDTSLACLVTGYLPSPVAIKWNSGKVTQGVKDFPEVTMSDGLHTRSSLLILPDRSRQGDTYQCDVMHQGTAKTVSKTFPRECIRKKEPSVTVSRAYHEDISRNRVSLILICEASGFYPEEISISWLKNNSPELKSSYNNGPVSGSGTFSAYSILKVEQSQGDGNYTCMVHHPAMEEPKSNVISLGCDLVSLLPPSLEDLYIVQNATISCLVSGMETPGSLEVSWSRGSGGLLAVVTREPVLQEDGTYSVTSILRVCVEEWQAGEEFTCTVTHQDIPSAIVKTIHKMVSLRAPSVYISPPHAEELSLRESATITCLASGFQPREILVTWTQQDRPVPQETYTNIGPVREAGKEELYFIYSKLNVLASEWERGDTYACVVGHEGLPMTFIHRSVDKSSGKPTAVNVSVILSDTDVTCY